MEVTVKKETHCTLLEIKGRLDTTNYLELENKFIKLIENGEQNLLVDCANLDYVSSSGLRVFLIAFKTLNKTKGKFLLCNLQENVQEIFDVSGFISIFKVFKSREEAMLECQ